MMYLYEALRLSDANFAAVHGYLETKKVGRRDKTPKMQ